MVVSRSLSNLLTTTYLNRLTDTMTSRGFPWYFLPHDVTFGSGYNYAFGDVNLNTDDTDLKSPPKQTSVGWTHVLYHDGQPVSNYYDLFIPIVDHIQDRLGIGIFELFRLRLAMLHHNHFVEDYNTPHTDHDSKHMTGIYYFHDSDGDTVLFDQCDNPNGDVNKRINDIFTQNYTVAERHRPEENKFVLFNGNRFHASSNPKINQYRIVLNFNFRGMPHDILTSA